MVPLTFTEEILLICHQRFCFLGMCVELLWSYHFPPGSLVTVVNWTVYGATGSICDHGRIPAT